MDVWITEISHHLVIDENGRPALKRVKNRRRLYFES